ncbi:hypothetical protein P153DRAFT_426669 [Dothidotthia symphoricarpi CBS 119687]|uniref:Putative zinc-finger domain-containing protein n=1 Tax=Dothidotthia symphoricarpi CBS 119687 TaxID=1392245 RepID=A0A6A6A0Y6_9PLEO|nr:uncharacterized protein P153DRAFT_426669 [Dothidotthia symphoricarpi CBS 119687]KAF2124221.1 hypothetical protein P153DRAFT_426669 [Dothidotthia symphoricarpi CBS 119687]
MANNQYSQPYFGLPFAFSHQQMPQPVPTAHPESHAGSSDARQPPAPDAFPSLPGLNFTAYGQNTQQPQYSPTAWPPPPPDAWLPFMQNGMVPPPPLPGFGFPPPGLPPIPQHHPATPTAFPPRPATAANERVTEVMDIDREDGEVSDGEVASHASAHNAERQTKPEPPRSTPQTSRVLDEPYNPSRPAAGQKTSQEPARKPAQPQSAQPIVDTMQQNREAVRQFVKLLNSNNVGYRALANEVDDSQRDLLRGVYSSCNLASEPEPIVLPKANGAGQASAISPAVQPSSVTQDQPQNVMLAKTVPAVKTNVNPVPPVKSAPSPVDRKDYIARLQAAKKAKQAGAMKPSPPRKTTPTTVINPVPAVKSPQPASTPMPKQPATDEQKARNTELIKKRLAAIKAGKKPASTASNGPVSSSSPAPVVERAQGTTAPLPQAASNGANTPNPPSHVSSFPGLPGLFMNMSPNPNGTSATVSKPSLTIPQKRPAPSDKSEVSTPRGSVASYTRPLGESPHTRHNEQVIINIDDSEGSDMDIEDDQDAPKSAAASPLPPTHDIHQTPGKLPDFPLRPASVQPASSAVSTPGPQTPATLARKDGIDKKERELAALKITLKKKLAEKREKDRAAAATAAAAISTPSSLPPRPPMPELPPQNTSHVQPVTMESSYSMPIRDGLDSTTKPRFADSPSTHNNNSRRRREQILLEQSSYDAELVSNQEQVARLTKEMGQLLARNEKLTKDKARLAEELESLGVDTEGMSHAELRAKKDEIEHAKSPLSNSQPQDAGHISQPIINGFKTSARVSPPAEIPQPTPAAEKSTPVALMSANSMGVAHITLPGLGRAVHQAPEPKTADFHNSVLEDTPAAEPMSVMPQESRVADTQDFSQSNEILARADTDRMSINGSTSGARRSATPLDDEEDFYSPPPPAATPTEAENNIIEGPQAQVAANMNVVTSPSEEGEVEMSLSTEDEEEEEEYEPEEPTFVTDIPIPENQVPEPDVAQSSSSPDVSTDEEEPYEPPDFDQEMTDIPVATMDATVGQNEPEDEVEDGAMDIATSSSDESSDSDSDEESSSDPEDDDSISASNAPLRDTDIADDLAPELQTEPVPVVSISETVPVDDDQVELDKFTPYESPLRMFKSYRYHPSYTQDVSGGFLSMTYSHQIDAETPLCQYESAGGSCNDAECPDQHFRGMGITGEKLLVQLGTANPGKTPEAKQKWNDGLRGVLKELRQKNIKDPNGIAEEIAKYRREFLDDDTRVVNL